MAAPCAFGLAAFIVLVILAMAPVASASVLASVTASGQVPEWALDSPMHLELSMDGDTLSQEFTIIPLTRSIGANGSDPTLANIRLSGRIILAEPTSYTNITDRNYIAYLSCDDTESDSIVHHNTMLNNLMDNRLTAIVLYSTSKDWCGLDDSENLSYNTIFSMADAAESVQVRNYLNETDSGDVIRANITGDGNDSSIVPVGPQRSSTAMSILYAVTAVVATLFIVIIATGAVRAHRYPERYGPRRATGGRSRQSRAKGIARAVLETIPIVKFGSEPPGKPDPDLEMETGTTDGRESTARQAHSNQVKEGDKVEVQHADSAGDRRASAAPSGSPSHDDAGEAEHLGCTICTEDFKLGEDVRVLPCKHQFHPSCIDPWLVDVSGTCPLCRLDLRPNRGDAVAGQTEEGSPLPPPLAMEGEYPSTAHRNRISRFLDIHRLRQASVETQMAALRQMQAERGARHDPAAEAGQEQVPDVEDGRQRARFAKRLRDRFRIRTRAQSRERGT
ncbi:hypothetical protein B0I35DRAFT_408100 [Stachybotrys elegans]|uniref:RING-type E3 ubiquitin transferase n=1 Tax=Stachybotrys elegans TaxID=80388 RepID=A0A8K0SYG5_9HYPO|nr:hypothetical protein B0I35DRAFT_408100 [Stachybotrys elegans]